jgi:hypothetical protein
MGNLSPVGQLDIGNHPTLPIPFQVSYDHFTVGDVGSRRIPRLSSIRLLQPGTIHIAKINHVLSTLMVNCQAISLVNHENPCNEVSPCDAGTGQYENRKQDSEKPFHDSVCYPPQIIPPMNSRFGT